MAESSEDATDMVQLPRQEERAGQQMPSAVERQGEQETMISTEMSEEEDVSLSEPEGDRLQDSDKEQHNNNTRVPHPLALGRPSRPRVSPSASSVCQLKRRVLLSERLNSRLRRAIHKLRRINNLYKKKLA